MNIIRKSKFIRITFECSIRQLQRLVSPGCTIFVIRIDVKLMEVSVNLVYFPFNGGIYNIYGAVDFPRYMTTFDSENKHNKSMINNDTRLFSTNDHKVINTG